ncbi:cysteine desulfurase family protein [Candidatus Raskinella chloraquaticus]|jgi:cysteine desulfurase|uniref:cysteine desulfurase family protein n=1 Tax=Candidatus Raskinella chloraquaticus TaxID=1951219 RepID=UPI00366E77C7
MDGRRAYLDCNATAPLRPEARAAALAALELAANPSAVHQEGRRARRLLEEARLAIAGLINGQAGNVIFTSGGSEGAAMVLAPGFCGTGKAPAERLVVSAIEHSAVLSAGRFAPADVAVCPVTGDGVIDLAALDGLLAGSARPALVAVMLANNETGIIQPVAEVAALGNRHGASLVCDAVQAAGKMPVDIASLGADAIIVSGHKLGAPQGSGAVILGEGVRLGMALIRGGAQEHRQRAGTENVSGIAGLGAACDYLARLGAAENGRIRAMRDDMEARLVAALPGAHIMGQHVPRLPNTSLVMCDDIIGETAVIALDLAGIAVATGSACASGKVAPSHVLKAMALDDAHARSALRVSLGWATTPDDIDKFIAAFAAHRNRIAGRAAA